MYQTSFLISHLQTLPHSQWLIVLVLGPLCLADNLIPTRSQSPAVQYLIQSLSHQGHNPWCIAHKVEYHWSISHHGQYPWCISHQGQYHWSISHQGQYPCCILPPSLSCDTFTYRNFIGGNIPHMGDFTQGGE